MASTITPTRNTKLDSVKTILIFMVVLGHTLQSRDVGILNSINVSIKVFIFSFHMPLFIIISGYFFNTKASTKTFFKRLVEILASYVVFQAIRVVLSGNFGIYSILNPKYTLWYLLCLVYWRLLTYYLSKIISTKIILLLSIVICMSAGFVDTTLLSFQRACVFFPFFVMGNLLHSFGYIERIDKTKIYYGILSVIAVTTTYCVVSKTYDVDFMTTFQGKPPYYGTADITMRCVWFLLSIPLCYGIYRIIPDSTKLAKYGGSTLAVYLLHSFFTERFGFILRNTFLTNDIITNVLYSLLVMTICIQLYKIKLIKRIISPIKFAR